MKFSVFRKTFWSRCGDSLLRNKLVMWCVVPVVLIWRWVVLPILILLFMGCLIAAALLMPEDYDKKKG